MKAKLLYLMLCILMIGTASGQSIAIVGEAVGGWPDNDPATPDTHIMSTSDNITYTLSGLTITTAVTGGGAKFRQDGAWTINWGSTAFPSGTGALNGANIVTVAGTYDITFNRLTGAYSFVNVTVFPSIGIIGTAVNSGGFDGPDVDMITFDGITYTLNNYDFTTGEAKFRQDDAWTFNWGAGTFPTGTATLNGNNIPVTAGTYSVTYNIQTGAYSFDFPKIGLIGTAVSANGFDGPDTNLSTTDGVNYTLYNHVFTDGEAKFRLNDAWDTNWGSMDFPTGTGTQNGENIAVIASTYTVNFNRLSGEYAFTEPVSFVSIGMIGTAVSANGFEGDDIDLTTTDGIAYTIENYTFTDGFLKFRESDQWAANFGGPDFPNGTATLDGVNIPVTAGTYTLTFYRTNLAYSFVGTPAFPTVGILGSAVSANSFNGPDVNLTTTDGITYTLTNHTFTAGEAKFRQDDAWEINWGSADFPSGTGNLNGQNINVLAGTFDVTFNRSTGEYAFTTSGEFPSVGIIGTAISPDGFNEPDINLTTTNGIIYTLTDFTFITGEAKFRQDDAWEINWGSADFPTGIGALGGNNILVTGGTYNVTFNRLTGAYSFLGDAFPSVGILGDAAIATGFDGPDVNLTTNDGINYNLNAHDFVSGSAKFRQDDAWEINWGNAAFPTGTGTQNGDNIAVAGNRYNVYFNRSTGDYAFNYVSIGIIGTAVNGFDAPDVDLSTEDGMTFTINDFTLTDGLLKFRENDSWTVNWGGTDFPSAVYVLNGDNIPVTAGTYNITFSRMTGATTFVESNLGVTDRNVNPIKVYPNPSKNSWNFATTNEAITGIKIMDVSGKLVFETNTSANEIKVDVTNLTSGIYFAKITSANAVQTIKVIKN